MRISDWSSDVCSSDLLVVLDHVGRRRVLVERAGLVLLDPDADQVARDVVTLRQTVQRLAGEKLLRDLPLELDAMGTVSCHGRSEEHTSELQSLMRISYAVFCLKKKTQHNHQIDIY